MNDNNQNLNNNPKIIQVENYANLVLQALMALKTTKTDILNDIPTQNMNTPLTDDFKTLFFGLFNSPENKFFKDFIKTYNSKANNNQDALLHDPYNFLKYLLIFLKEENIKDVDLNFLATYQQQKQNLINNGNQSVELFKNHFKKTQNSIISNNFYHSEFWLTTQCPTCGIQYCDYYYNPILELDIENIKKNLPNKPDNSTITLYVI